MSQSAPASPQSWTIQSLLAWSRGWFDEKGVDSPRLTAEILLAHVLNCPRIKLYADFDRPLEKPELARYKELVQRRARGEPVQYLVGNQDFYGRRFKSDKRALIPRPETELVAERVLSAFPKDAVAKFADIGCGSGILGLTLAAERPKSQVILTDVSPDAAALAKENAVLLGLASRVEVREGDLTAPLGDEVFDAVVTNLPYVPDGDKLLLPTHIRDHEPHLALFGGPDGLDLYRRFVPAIARHVKPGGLVVLEHGETHAESAPALFDRELWTEAKCESDLAGLPRFTWAVRKA